MGQVTERQVILAILMLLLFSVAVMVVGCGAQPQQSPRPTSTPVATVTPTRTPTPKSPAWEGTSIEIPPVAFAVVEFYRSKEVGPSSRPEIAQGVFAVVKLKISNNGSEPVSPSPPSYSFQLNDSLGRRFSMNGFASGFITALDNCPDPINPGLSGCIHVVFDIPISAEGLRLGIGRLSQSPSRWISLGGG